MATQAFAMPGAVGRIAAVAAARLRRARDFLTARRPTVIAPYAPIRTPVENVVRKTKLFSAVIFLGMFYGYFFALLPPAFLLWLMAPIAVLAIIVIWALPDNTVAPPLRPVEHLLFAFIVAWAVWPNYLAISLPGLPWITTVRLFAAPMALLLLICISVSADVRAMLKDALRENRWIGRLMVGFIVLQFITLFFSETPVSTLNIVVEAQFQWTAVFFASVLLFQRSGRAMLMCAMLIASTIVVCIVSEIEYIKSSVVWVGHVPSFLQIEDESVQRVLSSQGRAAIGGHRVHANFTTSLALSEFLGLMMPLIIHFAIASEKKIWRVLNALLVPIVFHVIMVSQSRLGMVAFFLSFILYVLLWSYRRWRRSRTDLIAPSIVFAYPAIFTLFILATIFVGRLNNMIWGTGAHAASDASRMTMFETALPMVARWPIGHGLGRGASTLGFTNGAGVLTIDSYFLNVLLELGIIGFFVYYAMFVIAGARAFRYSAAAQDGETALLAPLSIAMLVFIVIKSVFSADHGHVLVFLMLGMVVALTYRVSRQLAPVAAS